MMNVRETINHGGYQNIATYIMAPTWQDFVHMIRQSPYNGGHKEIEYANNKFIARLFADLLINGKGSHGWANYEVLP